MMIRKGKNPAIAVLLGTVLSLASKVGASNPVTNADELVAQHLDSIASPAVRAGLKTRVAQGAVRYTILVGGAGALDGKAFLVSDGKKFQMMMKLPNNDYHGEQFVFDGDKDKVAFSSSKQTRSPLGNFVFVQDATIREGILGGVLSTAWPLLNLSDRKAKVSFGGLKKMDGQDLYELRYRPHKNSDLEINFYFDPQTYRHIETTYSYSVSASFADMAPSTAVGVGPTSGAGSGTPSAGNSGGTAETAAARQVPNRYRLQEKFSDFKTVDGVTLPTHYDIQFSQELQNGKTTLLDWDLKQLEISNNAGVDPRNFEVK